LSLAPEALKIGGATASGYLQVIRIVPKQSASLFTPYVLEEALSKPTLRKTRYEAKGEIYFRKQAVSKKVYRVKKLLEATGFPIKHKPKVLRQYAEFIEKIRRFAAMKDNLENKKVNVNGMHWSQTASQPLYIDTR